MLGKGPMLPSIEVHRQRHIAVGLKRRERDSLDQAPGPRFASNTVKHVGDMLPLRCCSSGTVGVAQRAFGTPPLILVTDIRNVQKIGPGSKD